MITYRTLLGCYNERSNPQADTAREDISNHKTHLYLDKRCIYSHCILQENNFLKNILKSVKTNISCCMIVAHTTTLTSLFFFLFFEQKSGLVNREREKVAAWFGDLNIFQILD